MATICFNGKFTDADKAVLPASNRSYRYGDGLFETMKVKDGVIQLAASHMERLFDGMSILKMDVPALVTKDKLMDIILELCKQNRCEALARVRLSVSRGNGGLYDEDRKLQYLVECWPLNQSVNRVNENGLVIDIFPDAAKSTDRFSNLKSANFLVYSMAAVYAKENKLNDCLVLNANGKIADSTIANLFLVKGDTIFTPALSEGCVNGVMRKYLLESLAASNYQVEETIVSAEDLLAADEVFLSNAINGIRWVQRFRNKIYSHMKTMEIYRRFCQTIPG
ncbi:MAG TPA: aminotransferase class IV [Chitinophagaceae bacterium]|nr:aminotransferase class IV [Chitinophagaceae bacterium]HRF19627.1 aminotransferase class IV [Chitinophagaceae bacterium]